MSKKETGIYQLKYLTISKEIYQDRQLNDISRRVCAFIYNYSGSKFYFRNNQLAKMFNCSDWSISMAIKKLIEQQYVSVRYSIRKGGGKIRYIKRLKNQRIAHKVEGVSDFGKTQSLKLAKPNLYTKDNKIKDNTIHNIWNSYLLKAKTKEILLPGRVKKITARLKLFTEEQIKQAITNCFNSPFHTGENDRGWIANADFIFGSDKRIDNLLNLKVKDNRTWEEKIVDKMEKEGLTQIIN